MIRKLYWITSFAVFALFLTGCFALQEAEKSSGAVVAPTLVASDSTDAAADNSAENSSANDGAETTASNETIYTIDPTQSEARFYIDEVLQGADKKVIGTTSNIAGQVAFDLNNPAAAQIGEMVINARDFATDNNFRNNAIRNEILQTDQYELITFTPKTLIGLPDTAVLNEDTTFQVVGALTLIGQTQEVTFDVTATPVSATELHGKATATIQYADWGITVPLSRMVQAVADEVTLELEFVATAP